MLEPKSRSGIAKVVDRETSKEKEERERERARERKVIFNNKKVESHYALEVFHLNST
jgi:hypothetical protein